MKRSISPRTRFFMPVEGEGEQSFIRWLQYLADINDLHIYLDCKILNGGGYQAMLKKALSVRSKKEKFEASILLIDADRSPQDDNWSLDILREEATKKEINICFQYPNQEGLLLRLFPGNEHLKVRTSSVHSQLCRAWPNYKKPVDFYALKSKFSLDDLRRVAQVDLDIFNLLKIIRLIKS